MNDDDIQRKKRSKVRTHGFKYPLHPYQVGSWVFYLINIVSYFLIIVVSLNHRKEVIILLSIMFIILMLT